MGGISLAFSHHAQHRTVPIHSRAVLSGERQSTGYSFSSSGGTFTQSMYCCCFTSFPAWFSAQLHSWDPQLILSSSRHLLPLSTVLHPHPILFSSCKLTPRPTEVLTQLTDGLVLTNNLSPSYFYLTPKDHQILSSTNIFIAEF